MTGDKMKRVDPAFPKFWPLQMAGWICFLLYSLVPVLPALRDPSVLRPILSFTFATFAASCLLRPICRTLMRRYSDWIALEVRAFACCIPFGIVAGYITAWLTFARFPNLSEWPATALQVVFILFVWCSLYFSIKLWQQSGLERERWLRAETQIRDAQLRALRYQLNPHFLFNSLNTVSTLVLEGDNTGATKMIARIGDLLRTTLDGESPAMTPLANEIAFIEQYLAIEQIRFGDRLRVKYDIAPETMGALVPSMVLQPLVENAVRHGIAPVIEGGTLAVRSALNDGHLRISVQNSGPVRSAANDTAGIGLSNTADRLRTLYGDDHRFDLSWPTSGGCEVVVEVPVCAS